MPAEKSFEEWAVKGVEVSFKYNCWKQYNYHMKSKYQNEFKLTDTTAYFYFLFFELNLHHQYYQYWKEVEV